MAVADKGRSGYGRFVWLLAFLIVNVAGMALVVWGVAFRQVQLEDIRMVACTPRGEVAAERTREVVLEFDQEINPATVTADTVSLLPRVEGRVELAGGKSLKLLLSEPLARATRYRLVLSPALRGLHGESLGEYDCEFNTPALAVEKVVQGSVDIKGGINLDIGFNAKVDPRDLSQALTLVYRDKHKPEFTVLGQNPAEHLIVHIADFNRDTAQLRISAGLASIEGPLALDREYAATVKLEDKRLEEADRVAENGAGPVIYVSQQVRFTGMEARNESGTGYIIIKANTPFNAAEAEDYVNVEPAVAYSFEPRDTGLVIKGDFEAGKRYRVTLKQGLPAGIAGVLEKTVSRSVWFPDRGEDIEFTYGGGYLSTKGMLLVPVKATNLKEAELTVYKLYPENIVEYVLTGEDSISYERATEIAQQRLEFTAEANKYQEQLLDLRKLAGAEPSGVYSLSVRGVQNRWERSAAVVSVSDLGLTARVAGDSVLCWVTALSTAKPVAGAEVELYSDRRQKLGNGKTDENGLCRVAFARLPAGESAAVLVVRKAGDMSYLGLRRNLRRRGEEAASGRPYLTGGYEAYVAAERGVYRPGDTVHVAAFIRGKGVKRVADMPLDIVLYRPDGKEYLRKRASCDELGRIAESVVISENSLSGYYKLAVTIPGEKTNIGSSGLRVADYVPQTLSMKLEPAAETRFPGVEQKLKLGVEVKHLFGSPAAGLKVSGQVECSTEMFEPEGWAGYSFTPAKIGQQRRKETLPEKLLGAGGKSEYDLECLRLENAPVVRETVEITAHEKGGRSLSESIEQKFYPWQYYLGIRAPEGELKPEKRAEFELAVVGRDGGKYTQKIAWKAELYAVNWSNVLRKQGDGMLGYDWTRKEKLLKEFGGSATAEAQIPVIPGAPGHYMLKVKAEGSYAVAYDFFVAGRDDETWIRQDPDQLKLLTDSKIYKPGQTAKVSLQAPFAGTALVCVEGETVLANRVVRMQKGVNELEFAVSAEWRPNVYVSVTLVRAVEAAETWLPHRASGVVRLAVDCEEKRLQVRIAAAESVRPAQKAGFKIQVFRADGTVAANTAVVVAAVDTGVLKLDDFKPENPWDLFYALRRLDIGESDMYSRLAPELAKWRVAKTPAPGGGGGYAAEAVQSRLNPVKAKRVHTAVLYSGKLRTDAGGNVSVDFMMPEYIGELQVMVLAADGDQFGMAQQALPVKAPLMFQASWPRFLAPGDVCSIPLTLFNNTGKDGDVVVELAQARNIELLDTDLARVPVKAGAQKTVMLKFRAGNAGVAKSRIRITMAEAEFAQNMELPVRPAAMFKRISKLSVIRPSDTAEIGTGGNYLEDSFKGRLTVTSNPVAEVSGQLSYLLQYPYGCLEQTISRMLPLLYMPDLARIVCPESIGEQEVAVLIDAGLQRLLTMQTWSGGLAMWPGGSEPSEWATVYAADFMIEARKAGYAVPEELVAGVLGYNAEQLGMWCGSTDSKGIPDRLDLAAYAAYVLCRGGMPPHSWLASIEEELEKYVRSGRSGMETARCYLAAAYLCCGEVKAAKEFLQSMPGFATERSSDGMYNSPLRERAILLSTLLDVTLESPLIPELVSALKVSFSDPWQASTQDNAFALQALGKYARKKTIDTEGKAEVVIAGHTEEFNSAQGRSFALRKPAEKIAVTNTGKTPLYAYLFAQGIPAEGKVQNEDSGLSVCRYITDSNNKIVKDELIQGRLYRIHLVLTAPRPVQDMVIVDMLAAGIEIENQDLKGAAMLGSEQKQKGMKLVNVEKLDDRLLLFADLPEGRSEYSYVVRAVNTGEFSWPACDAAAMYDPAVFSVNGGGKLKVIK